MVLDFKRSSGEDARALMASSGGKHRFEKYMAMPLVFLHFTEKQSFVRIFVKVKYSYRQKNRWRRVPGEDSRPSLSRISFLTCKETNTV